MPHQILDRISSDIREIMRLLRDSNSNTDVCLQKLESAIVHFNSIRHLLDPLRRASVEQSLFALRDELRATPNLNADRTCYCAERPLNGK